MTIEGDYTLFAHLETVYLGVLARRTLISTNVARVLEAANGKPIIFMPARHDHHRVQTGDGYAAYVAGAMIGAPIGVTSDAQASWWGGRGVGTVPHALIASYGGEHRARRDEVRRVGAATTSTSPCSSTSRTTRCRRRSRSPARSGRSSGACGSTPRSQLVDRSLWEEMGDFDPTRRQRAARAQGARRARRATGSSDVRIVASGGFTVEKIEEFERRGVPVDAYGVGSSLIRGENDFTADIVLTRRPPVGEGRPHAPSEPAARACRLVSVGAPLGRRHAGRLHAPGRQARRAAAQRRSCRRWRRLVDWARGRRDHARRLRRRPRADRPGDLRRARLHDDVSAALPARHARARKIPETEQQPIRCRSRCRPPWPTELRSRPARVPAPEEELRRLHEPEHRARSSTALDPSEVILFGVATDVCDHAAVMGLLRAWPQGRVRRGRRRGPRTRARVAACLAAWREAGVGLHDSRRGRRLASQR